MLGSDRETLAATGGAGNSDEYGVPARARLEPGALLGRYVIIQAVGHGATGTVYAAFDPVLDRKIALKILHRTDASKRAVAEARSAAKLNHPNVVTVYDVGTVGEYPFIAMEFIEGETLRDCIDEPPREREAITDLIDVFCSAGQGLEAAHRAGLVHRDFKPENVMIGANGRVVVMDFGLAVNPNEGDTARTSLAGTLAYMSPEHFDYEAPVGPASDQFAFAVSLWEALHGERPYGGDDKASIAFELVSGEMRTLRNPAVPGSVNLALERALEREPAKRYSSMAQLLAALRHDPRRGRRRLFAWAGGIVAAGVAVSALLREPAVETATPADPCASAGAPMEHVWNAERSTRLLVSFELAAGESGRDSHAAVARKLDRYGVDWSEARQEACVETDVEAAVSVAVQELRYRCLDDARSSVEDLLGLLEEPSEALVRKAPAGSARLPPLDRCGDIEYLRSERRAPPDDIAPQVAEIERGLQRAVLQVFLGQPGAAEAELESLGTQADSLGHAPTVAEIYNAQALVFRVTGRFDRAQSAAIKAAESALHEDLDHLAVSAMAQIIDTAARMGNLDRARAWLEVAEAVLPDPMSHEAGTLALTTALVARQEGDLERAEDAASRGVGIYKTLDPVGIPLGNAYVILGGVLEERDDPGSIEVLELAVQLTERNLGDRSFNRAVALNNLASALMVDERVEEALPLLENALGIKEEALGENNPALLTSLNNTAYAYLRNGEVDEALALSDRGIEIAANHEVPVQVAAMGHANRSLALIELDRSQEALESSTKALELVASAPDYVHPRYQGDLYVGHSKALAAVGHKAKAVEAAYKAREAYGDNSLVSRADAWIEELTGRLPDEP